MLIWFWDARTTYPQNVKNASYSSERVSKCVCVCVWVWVFVLVSGGAPA